MLNMYCLFIMNEKQKHKAGLHRPVGVRLPISKAGPTLGGGGGCVVEMQKRKDVN